MENKEDCSKDKADARMTAYLHELGVNNNLLCSKDKADARMTAYLRELRVDKPVTK